MVLAKDSFMNGAGRLLTQQVARLWATGFGPEVSGKEVAVRGFPKVDSWEEGWQAAQPVSGCVGLGGAWLGLESWSLLPVAGTDAAEFCSVEGQKGGAGNQNTPQLCYLANCITLPHFTYLGFNFFSLTKWDQVVQPVSPGGYENMKSFIGLPISVG